MAKQLNLFDFEDQFSILSLVENEFLPDEYFEIEYKSAQGGFPVKEFWKTYSAFANTNTGFIILGISEKNEEFIVEGLDEQAINKYKKQFWDDCNNPNTISVNLLTNNDIKVLEIKGNKVLAFRVPFAKRTERPVHLTRNPFGNTYKRNHEGDYRCTDEEVKRMVADSSGELKRDGLILENFTAEDFDIVSVKQYRQMFSTINSSHPWNALDDIEFFKRIGAVRKDRRSGKEGVTIAGLMMFGKSESIAEQDVVPNFFPDFRENLSGNDKIRWTDRVYPDGTWENNLLQFYLKVWPKLSSTLPKPFQLKNDERIDESPAHTALREAFVNAIVHTDYSLSGNIIVQLDTERFVFSNPGTLLVSISQYYEGGVSECRNPALQQMFMMLGRAEKAGSGVDKIMSGWNYALWRKPFLELENQPDRVKLTLPMFSILPEKILDELQERFGSLDALSPDELTALSFCLIEGNISNNRLQYVLNIHSTEITSLLKNLVAKGYLENDNYGRWTTYQIASDNKVATISTEVATQNDKLDSSALNIDFQESEVKNKVDTSEVATSKVASSKVASSEIKIPRLKRAELESQIMQYCSQTYRTKEELATFLNKSEDYLRNKIIPQMLREKKLKQKYPFTQTHPEQAYKTSEDYEAEQ